MATSSYDRWRQRMANTMWSWMNTQTQEANAATERDRNLALEQAETFRGWDFGLPQSTITADRNRLLAEQARFAGAKPDWSASTAMIGQDRQAGIEAGAALARGGSAMQDRATMLGEADRLEQTARQAGDTTGIERDRAAMLKELAEFKAQSAGIGEEVILKSLNEQWSREQAQNAQAMQMAMQVAASRGVQMDEWKLSQVAARLNAESQQRMASTEMSLRMQDLQMKQQARQVALGQMAETLTATRKQEQQALATGLAGQTTAAGMRQETLDSTRRDQLQQETTGTQVGQAARESTRQAALALDQVREQLRLQQDTAALGLLDRALAMGRSETRANNATRMTQEQYAAEMITRILEGTERQVMDPSALAKMISMMAGG